jgi:hypothetical protein
MIIIPLLHIWFYVSLSAKRFFYSKLSCKIVIRNKEVLHIQTDVMLNPSHAALSESENMFGERV